MANYWVISIGINQYRHFQPLMHAQNDARFVHRFFTEEAGIPADRCILLSDLATSVGEQVVYPDKPAIAAWIQTITHQIKADDVLWFFFSGYGAQAQVLDGHSNDIQENGLAAIQSTDYLMPIDGDPGRIESTGIAVADLINTLASLPTDKALLILDINRSQGALAGQTIGTQVIDLAQKQQVATLLSCQPEQYSHETLGVRHGLFTAALLEALRQKDKTAGQIVDYLNQRLPELCEHHWRPTQNPVSVLSTQQQTAEVVPELSHELLAIGSAASLNDAGLNDRLNEDKLLLGGERASGVVATAAAIATGSAMATATDTTATDTIAIGANDKDTTATDAKHKDRPTLTTGLPPVVQPPNAKETDSTEARHSRESVEMEEASAVSGAKLRNWGLLALAILMGLVLLKQPFVKVAWDRLTETETATPSEQSALEDSASKTTPADGSAGTAAPNTASEGSASETPATAAATPSAQTLNSGAEPEPSAQTTAQPTANSPVAAETEKASAQTLMSQAKAALDKKQYSEALIALQQVPKSQRDDKFSSVLTQARAGSAQAQQTNASVLTEARTSIQPTQASQFTEAIAKARLIQPGEPYYEAAQQDIRGWSQVILDIAEGRATSGNLDSAIAAAGVMPYTNAEYHQKAKDRIAFWQQRQQSRQIIADAQKIPKLGQASSYQQGIVKLREVPIEHPEYEAAQRLADQWSESIFSIAQARAAQNRESAAIQAAVLVPAGTTAYEPTQQAIRRWRSEGE